MKIEFKIWVQVTFVFLKVHLSWEAVGTIYFGLYIDSIDVVGKIYSSTASITFDELLVWAVEKLPLWAIGSRCPDRFGVW